MVIVSTFGGFYLGALLEIDWLLLFHTLLGSWMVAAGTNALNQVIEKDVDGKMKRTCNRPLPAGRVSRAEATTMALVIAALGIMQLALAVNPLTALLAALTLLSYVLIYTPMKRVTSMSTVIGAIPGALPAMGGWTAVRGEISVEAWILFAILFFWQLPHFLAIAWLYREDYKRGGFPVLPVLDRVGTNTGLHIIANCLALLSVSLVPTLIGLTGLVYFVGAFIIGSIFLYTGIQVLTQKSNHAAKRLLRASIAYLPILYILMFVDKIAV